MERASAERSVPDGGPVSWRLERNLRQVTFASSRALSVFSETTSASLSAPHAHPAWTLLVPVDGGSVTVIADKTVRVHNDAVLVSPQQRFRSATDGPHVAVYVNAWMAPRTERPEPRLVPAAVATRMLDALVVEEGVDLDGATTEFDRLVGPIASIDARLAFAIDALPRAYRLDLLAAEIGVSPSRLRALALDAIGVPLTQLRLWSRLARAIALLPYGPAADAAAAAGFADQPHFTRTARRFLGRTPADLSLRSLELRTADQRQRAHGPARSD
jgi:AraC-like DNA-binding protein